MPVPPAVQQVVEAFKRAQLAGDPAASAALFSDDAVMYPPVSQAVVRGRPAIDQLLQAVHRRLRIVEVDYTEVSGDAAGELAHLHWRYALRIQVLAAGGAPTSLRGRLSWVLKRTEGDAWRVAVHHASLEPPAEPATAVSWTRADRP
jgi:uncharacterized protein (TIGR02246 family)